MSQHIPGPGEKVLPFPDFHDELDLFADDDSASSDLYPRRRRTLIIVSIGLMALLLATVLVVVKRWPHIIYQAQHITRGDLVLTFNATGPLHTNAYNVNFTNTGKLAEIDVKVGQQVKKDQILAKLDTTSLQTALNEAQANVVAAQTAQASAKANYDATLSANKANVDSAWKALESANKLLEQVKKTKSSIIFSIALASVDAANQQLVNARAQQTVQNTAAQGLINAAQTALTTAQAQLMTAKYNLSSAVLKAPHNGIIVMIDGIVGGTPGVPFIQVVDPASVQVQANVDESNIDSVAVGDIVKFSLNAYHDQSFEGKVAAISPLGQSISNIITYPVLIDIVTELPDNIQLFPGMTARTTITTNDRPDALLVPVSALNFARVAVRPRAETDHHSLISQAQIDQALDKANDMLQNLQQHVSNDQPAPAFVLERDGQGKIVIKPIVIGLTDGKVYEVLDGLSADDVVLVGARTGSD